ncbi:hypothetical protein HDV00_010243 [Rhizophlyctis rosea]|nr:hypothetical protein HDV00_010243 [Rhizophlyctis rosea]
MIDLVTPLPAIEETEWNLASALPNKEGTKVSEGGDDVVQKFKKEVATWRWFLPPGMAKMKAWSDVIPNQVQLEFDLVVFRFNLLVDVLAGNWEQVVKAEKMITKGMNTDPTFMDATALKMLLESVIPNDQLKAFQLGQKFCEIVADTPSRQFSSMSSIVGVLLFPTIFDAERWLAESGFEVGGKAGESNKPPSDENLASPTSPTTTSEFQPAAALARRQNIVKEWIERKRHAVGGVAPNREEALKRLKAIGAKEKGGENKAGGPVATVVGDEKRVQALKSVVEDTKKCLDMVQLDIRIHKAITNAQRSADGATAAASSEFAGEEIVRLVHAFEISDSLLSMNPQKGGGKVRRSISAYTNRMFLDALLASAAFDEYFAVAVELSVTYYSFPFGRTLLRQMTREALPRIKSFTDTLYSQAIAQITQSLPADASATLAPTTTQNLMSGVRILKDALYKVIRATLGIANGLSVASGKDTNVDKSAVEGVKKVVEGMTQHLGNLSADLFKTLQTIDRVSSGSNRPAKEAAQLVFDPIKELTRQSVQFLDTTSQNSATIIHDVVNETNSMLEKLNKIIKDVPM